MGQFKPMVKMETTEPSVILKLKKGGSVGHKTMPKMMDGGVMGAMGRAPATAKPAVANPALLRAMAARKARPAMGAPMVRPPMAAPPVAMKKGGEMETPAMHRSEMKAISGVDKKLSKHAGMAASKAHKGLKTGGVVLGQGGYKDGGKAMMGGGMMDCYNTGGVVLGQGGYKKGGSAKKAFATGGSVNDAGRPVAMPKKAPAAPAVVDRLSGAFKRGGVVC